MHQNPNGQLPPVVPNPPPLTYGHIPNQGDVLYPTVLPVIRDGGGGIAQRLLKGLKKKKEKPCCPPQVVWDQLQGLPQTTEITVNIPGCNLAGAVAVVLNDPTVPNPNPVPTIVSQNLVVLNGVEVLVLVLNLGTPQPTSGRFLVRLTNPCGCCTIFPITIVG